jgi:predicted short-subunit dehydrogenase-like oxidoreductase (DUF2520 family)
VTVAVIGAGRVGTGVALLLQRSGHGIVAVAPEGRESTGRAEAMLGARAVSAVDAAGTADLVLLGVPDHPIPDLAAEIAPALKPGTVVCHFAGALGIEVLSAAFSAGALRAAIHPVQACPDPQTAVRRLPGSAWGVTCDEPAAVRIQGLIENDLSGRVVWVDEDIRPLWHAASVTAANGIAALLALGEDMLRSAGIEEPVGVLGPLAAGVVANAVEGGGGGRTLTGPVVRGEVATLRLHIEALEHRAPGALVGYRRVAGVVLTAAQNAGRIDDVTAARIRDLLESR